MTHVPLRRSGHPTYFKHKLSYRVKDRMPSLSQDPVWGMRWRVIGRLQQTKDLLRP